MTDVWTMSEAAGASARAIRIGADATLAEVAQAAKAVGLPWSSGRVGDFESGRIAPSLPTLIAVAGALSMVVEEKVIGLPDLFEVDGRVQINHTLTLDADRLRDLLRGDGFEVILHDLSDEDRVLKQLHDSAQEVFDRIQELPGHLPGPSMRVLRDLAEGDERLARSLSVDKVTAAAAMTKLWNKTFVQRRDELAGPGANAQKKGIVTRQLKSELKAVIDGDD
ncbi:hypothetical protein [Mycolicibacterium sp. D5.8-2]|uniref:hypothetical protein n=1 Tax=Mycolicibacterium sp. D5.8-2 TaxID=3085903 RepID=UPI00298C7D89|nr:hypothetical protein [Mycolicibacterium sp. D5.8-2]MDW5609269.1 hypothetical protein [Mycolicibacterium sp. D5.8-2]